jgi:hypothetical protein
MGEKIAQQTMKQLSLFIGNVGPGFMTSIGSISLGITLSLAQMGVLPYDL